MFPSSVGNNLRLVGKFQKTLQVLSQIKHPRICSLIDSGIDNGRPFLILSYVDAGNLEDRIRAGTLSALSLSQVIHEIAMGLSHAHERDLIHGNLRPSDIMFDEQGHVQLVGFGEASILRSMGKNKKGELASFRAPETSNIERISPASDQYSLAIIALQMLTNMPPEAALMMLRAQEGRGKGNGKEQRTFSTLLSREMIDVLSRALAEKPSHRFHSIAEMDAAFQGALGVAPKSEPLPAVVHEVKPTLTPRPSKKPARAVLPLMIGLILLAVSVTAAIAFWESTSTEGAGSSNLDQGINEVIKLPPIRGEADEGAQVLPDAGDPSSNSQEIVSNVVSPTPPSPGSGSVATSEPTAPNPTNSVPTNSDSTATALPTSTPTPVGTIDLTPTPTDFATEPSQIPPGDASQTPTQVPSTPTQAPTQDPTIAPWRCKDNPDHHRYCTPTPSA
jgi:serine/threonine protein kinase